MVTPGASFASTMAGWQAAAALKGVPCCEIKLTILPPQQKPTIPHSLMSGRSDWICLRTFGMRSRVLGGAAAVLKNLGSLSVSSRQTRNQGQTYSPSFSPFSLLSGGYHEMSAGLPSKKSGMNTWYWCCLSECARISAPCIVCGKKPKMS